MSSLAAVVAVGALAVAGALLSPVPPAPPRPVATRALPTAGGRGVTLALGPALAVLVWLVWLVWWLPPRTAVLVAITATTAVVAARMVRGRRTAREAGVRRQRVVELCGAVRAELAAGLTPAAALGRAAEDWPFVLPAARTADQGGDVAAALRSLAGVPGAEALRVVAAAWQVAHRTGVGLADALDRVVADLRAAERTGRVVAGELASAHATARLLAVLPLFALAMGTGVGGDPVGFLLGGPAGLGCLAAGLVLSAAGLAWIDAIARGVEGAG